MAAAIFFLRPKSKERATNTAFRWGYGVDSKHSKRVPRLRENACWDNPKPLYRKAVRKWKTEREIYR